MIPYLLRWKMSVLYSIDTGARSFAELKRVHPTLSDHILAARLRELRREGLICKDEPSSRHPFYTTTQRGSSLLEIVRALATHGRSATSTGGAPCVPLVRAAKMAVPQPRA